MKCFVVLLLAACVREPDPITRVLDTAFPGGASCSSFAVEGDEVVVREVHAGSCAGDPNTAPVRDRFRVIDNVVEHYDVITDSFTPLQ